VLIGERDMLSIQFQPGQLKLRKINTVYFERTYLTKVKRERRKETEEEEET